MSKNMGKKIGLGVAAALITLLLLTGLCALLVVNGTVADGQIPLWLLRAAAIAAGCAAAMGKRPRKRRRKKRR